VSKKNLPLLLLGLALLLSACGGADRVLTADEQPAASVQMLRIEQEGQLVYEGELAAAEGELRFTGSAGEYVAEVRSGRVRMLTAHCPDKLCLKQGWVEHFYEPIVCLPQQVVISITEEKRGSLAAFSEQRFLLDTIISVTLYASGEKEAQAAMEDAFAAFELIERVATRYGDEQAAQISEVGRINAAAGQAAVAVGAEISAMLTRVQSYAEAGENTFRVGIGPLVDLWGIGTERAKAPAAAEIEAVLPLLAPDKVVFTADTSSVMLTEAGMSLDLGGVAKGYATDLAVKALQAQGIRHALINAGGNVYALGRKPDGTPWRVGIRDPRRDGEIIGVVEAEDEAVVSSGDYERYFEADGVRYHHIFDPRTGYPARAARQSTVIAPRSLDADILSTITFILGREKSAALMEKYGCTDVFVDAEGEISVLGTGDGVSLSG
jgi:thiamine biosynthesis lipoprotein